MHLVKKCKNCLRLENRTQRKERQRTEDMRGLFVNTYNLGDYHIIASGILELKLGEAEVTPSHPAESGANTCLFQLQLSHRTIPELPINIASYRRATHV